MDFTKALNSVDSDGLWRLLRQYGVPTKVVNVIKGTYNNFRAQLVHNNKLSDPFVIRTGVREGCLLSPLLFLVVIAWITREVVKNEITGIQWTLTERLEDLDFADDVCLIFATHNQMQRKTEKLSVNASKLGMNISIPKTKVNAKVNSPISLRAEDFKWWNR